MYLLFPVSSISSSSLFSLQYWYTAKNRNKKDNWKIINGKYVHVISGIQYIAIYVPLKILLM